MITKIILLIIFIAIGAILGNEIDEHINRVNNKQNDQNHEN